MSPEEIDAAGTILWGGFDRAAVAEAATPRPEPANETPSADPARSASAPSSGSTSSLPASEWSDGPPGLAAFDFPVAPSAVAGRVTLHVDLALPSPPEMNLLDPPKNPA